MVAHGQMPEERLERTVQGFWNREYDILVCTTIVETGLDISNANTLIVERADTFGLSQLHQLRGRVGRSRERGYAYFLYPPHVAADRDGLRPVGHHRAEQRAGRGHGGRDEGPRDPRRRQRAGCRAVRARRRGRVSTCTCGWSARRWRPTGRPPTARPSRPPRSPRMCGSTCRSMRTCRRTTSPATGCAWRATGGWPRRLRRCGHQRGRRGAHRPVRGATRTRPAAGRGGAAAAAVPRRRHHRGVGAVGGDGAALADDAAGFGAGAAQADVSGCALPRHDGHGAGSHSASRWGRRAAHCAMSSWSRWWPTW